MIIAKSEPFSKEEIEKLCEQFGFYIKTVIDINKKVCSAGASRHFESEKILLDEGSKQSDLWGGGIDLETKEIDYKSYINIRPSDNNRGNDILDPQIRKTFEEIMCYLFKSIL